jgi:hypothetical protein
MFPLKVSSPSSSHPTDSPSLPDDALEIVVIGNDLKKEAAVIVDPVRSRPNLAPDSTEVQLLLIKLPAGMIRPSNYCEGGASWMGDQPLDWLQLLKNSQETPTVVHVQGRGIDEFRSSEHDR